MSQPQPETWGPVVIGPREIYDAVVRVSAKVDALSLQYVQVSTDQKDQEDRIRTLEKARWPLPSVAVLCSVAAVVLAVVVK